MSNDIDIKIKLEAAKAESQLARFNTQVATAAQQQEQAAAKTQAFQSQIKKLGDQAQNTGKSLNVGSIALASFVGNITSRIVSTAITSTISSIRGLIDAGRDFEAGLIQISKTTGLNSASIKIFGDNITELGRKLPVSTNSLLEIATVAGQLGIKGTENLTAFTETMAKLELASDITGETGSQSVARILTITGELEREGSDSIKKFGAVITELGNNFAATENQILAVANEVAKGTTVFKISSQDVLGLATAFKVTGSEAEVSGSVAQKVFSLIGKAAENGGTSLRKFSKAAGLTADQFKQLFKNDPTMAFIRLAEGLGQAGLSGAQLNEQLEELGFKDIRLLKSLAPLVTGYKTLASSINQARAEAEKKTALDEEARKASLSLNADLQKLSNAFDELGKLIFSSTAPALKSIVQGFTELLTSTKEIVNNKYIQGIAIAITIAAGAFAAVNAAILAYTLAMKGAAAVTAIMALEVTTLTGGLNLVIPVIASLVGILYAATNGFDDSGKRAAQFKDNVRDIANGYKEVAPEGQNFLDSLSDLTGVFYGIEAPLEKTRQGLDDLAAPMGNVGRIAEEVASKVVDSVTKIQLFELEKLQNLKKYFASEEAAKLQSNYNIMKSDEEREQFAKYVEQEGEKRQREAFARIIGLDKETLDAKKQHEQELRDLQRQAEESLDQYILSLEKIKQTEEENLLYRQGNNKIFNDQRLIDLQNYFTAQEEAEIQAKINSAKTELERQTLINNAVAQGLAKRKKLEETADRLRLQGAAATFSGLADIVALGGKRNFEAVKAFSIAESVIRGILQVQQALNTFPGPPTTVPYAVGIGIQAAARTAQIAAQKPTGFKDGGIVGGNSFSGDKVLARVNSGEMILNSSQQKQLFDIANNGTQGGGKEITINTTIELDGEVVGRSVSRQVANGLVLGEVQ